MGGWLFILLSLWPHIRELWLNWRQSLFAAINPHILMEVSIPEDEIRDVGAIEHLFNQLHSIYRSETWWERWWKGMYNLKVSVEIVSFEGHIKYYIRSTYKHKHHMQGAIYAQYPKAQIRELKDEEDFVHLFPDKMPDEEFEMLGTEYVLFKPHFFPIKTYKKHKTFGNKYADPLRHLLEVFSSLKEGEYMWYQVVIVPEREGWGLQFKHAVDKMQGSAASLSHKPSSLFALFFKEIGSLFAITLGFLWGAFREVFRQLFAGTGAIVKRQAIEHTYREVPRQLKGMGSEAARQILCLHNAFLNQLRKKRYDAVAGEDVPVAVNMEVKNEPRISLAVNAPQTKFPSEYLFLSEAQKKLIDSVEEKMSKPVFKTCVRALYFAKKPVYAKFRFWVEMHGFFRHFSDVDSNLWIRSKHTYTSADYFFARLRKRIRQNRIIANTKARDWFAGDEWAHLSSEELASMWHFPVAQDSLADVETVHEPVVPPPSQMRGRLGYKKERLVDVPVGSVPEDLPVSEFEPYNYG